MLTEVDKILDSIEKKREWTLGEYLEFCKGGIQLAKRFPDEKDKIAYVIAGYGAYFSDINDALEELQELGLDLELPDRHIDTTHSSISDKWARMEEIVDQEILRLKSE